MIKSKKKIFKAGELLPADYNPREIKEKSIKGLEKSLDRFGYLQNIIVNIRDKKNTIVGGHQRLKALNLPKTEQIECTIVDLSEIEEKALNVALNNKHISGEYDEKGLEKILSELKEDFDDFDLFNFDDLESEFKLDEKSGGSVTDGLSLDQAIQLKPPREYIVVMCSDVEDNDEFEQLKVLLNLQPVRRGGYKAGSAFDAVGTQRVINASDLIERLS